MALSSTGAVQGPSFRTREKPAVSATPKIRVALVGAGYVAGFHLEAMAGIPNLEIAAVCDPDRERARALADRWGIPMVLESAEELAGLGIQVAHVLTPPDLHVPVTRRLLEAGIAAFVEKPFALSSREARELAALAEERGVPLAVNHNNLHHPAFTRLLDWVRAGRVGRVEHVRICLSVPLAQLEAGTSPTGCSGRPRTSSSSRPPTRCRSSTPSSVRCGRRGPRCSARGSSIPARSSTSAGS
ncbi:MAG: Gfo/Idh/MocA family protein [Thermoanaerobaculia bacterium]